ncbi:C1 family peptidase [Chryseobacterium potabilaquae]|uniref:Peptidase C1A papain C-terminal domain-containing protein n=1 Tax=Chryseobacterium potabilaquae TaxID=2675057 RepID=A0A6N4X043_9FLAO|nr:C1 family peptidase [Chryseobacterium potabilaquae]CAA7194083.1 hypothetical protein CHRY9293_00461 [Chryseobacterium potabilaquae]
MKKTVFLAITGLVMTTITSCNQDRDEGQGSLSTTQSGMYSRLSPELSDRPVSKRKMLSRYGLTTKPNHIIRHLPSIGNQGYNEQSCVAWATAYAATTILERNFFDRNAPARSPRFIYNQINNGICTATPMIKEGLDKLVELGACSIDEMPYNPGECSQEVSKDKIAQAKLHKLTKWATVNLKDKALVKTLLANNFPIIISVPMIDSFGSINKNTDWTVTYCPVYNTGTTRHAVCVVGYDDDKKAFKVMNSYGKDFGDEGFFWISYDVFHGPTEKSPGAFLLEGYTAEIKPDTLPTD